jgi:fibronectin type 3 domain-containing protein
MTGKLTLIALTIVLAALAGCSDDSSSPVNVDTAPPAVPTDVTAMPTSSSVDLVWAPNTTDADFVGFKVYRQSNGETTPVPLVSTPQNITSYSDPTPVPGHNLYLISAVDQTGNESAYASIGVRFRYYHTTSLDPH